jgi:hypothetical protein
MIHSPVKISGLLSKLLIVVLHELVTDEIRGVRHRLNAGMRERERLQIQQVQST